jgi:CelD/BcsL family acetyltransferase involved in cellulose biosynthesis
MAEFVLSDFNNLNQPWQQLFEKSRYKLLFSSPAWSKLWWDRFGTGSELYLASLVKNGEIFGIAPLRIEGQSLKFIGSDNVCDFLDFVVAEGCEQEFFKTLLGHVANKGFTSLDLSTLLPDSATLSYLPEVAKKMGFSVSREQIDVSVDMELPHDIPTYLSSLNSKQRHEILRKDRRLNEEGDINYYISQEAAPDKIEVFLRFFRESREDKNRFLTDEIETYFRELITLSEKSGRLRLGILELNSVPVAVTLCFHYQNDIYLYNSGYNPDYRLLSVGVLSKYYCIRQSIESGKRRFDFLKGNEKYKYYLGGKEVPLFRCIINRQ